MKYEPKYNLDDEVIVYRPRGCGTAVIKARIEEIEIRIDKSNYSPDIIYHCYDLNNDYNFWCDEIDIVPLPENQAAELAAKLIAEYPISNLNALLNTIKSVYGG